MWQLYISSRQHKYHGLLNPSKLKKINVFIVSTVKPVFNGTWIKRKPVLNEQILWSREYSTKIHITFIKRKLSNAETERIMKFILRKIILSSLKLFLYLYVYITFKSAVL
jgi:hypothetical protein